MLVTPARLVAAKLGFAAVLALALAGAARAEDARTGTFTGDSGHATSGTVTVERDGDRTFVVLGEDFSLDGAPAPTLGFAKGGEFDLATEFAALGALTGRQVYEVPPDIDVSDHDTFVVWCTDFAVPLGHATLN